MHGRIQQLEDQCRDAQEAASRADQATTSKGEFLANMSHEIRTPLNSMVGITELLLETELSPHQKFQLNTVMHSAETLLRVINDILDFSKIESGTLALESLPFVPRQLAEEVIVLFAPRVREKARRQKLEILVSFDPALPEHYMGDASRVRQIVTNLVSNAVKFTSRGFVRLRVEPYALPGDGQGIRFAVTDTGIGIAADQRERIFQKFTQAQGVLTTKQFGGTGLGLAICRQLVSLMHGSLRVNSKLSEGSTFTVELPLPPAPSAAQPAAALPFTGQRAMVIDDTPATQQALQANLALLGIRSFAAEDIQSALEVLKSAQDADMRIDYVFAEWRLPDGGAQLFMQHLERMKLSHSIRVIGMSLLDDMHVARSMQQAGGQGFLRKPVLNGYLHQLLAAIEQQPMHFADTMLFQAESVAAQASDYPDYRRHRVLLVEDNRVNRELTIEILAKFNIAAECAENGREAITMAAAHKYDLILMDLQMPEMDGFEATRYLRARIAAGEMENVPVIALTANAMRGDRERCLEAGMDDYLSKPVRLQDVRSMLKRWFEPEAGTVGHAA